MRLKAYIVMGIMAGGALLTSAALQVHELGFEKPGEWLGPWGFGTLGGQGSGKFVQKTDGAAVRSGEKALLLTVEDDGSPKAVAWAGSSHMERCIPGSKVKAGAWFRYSSSDSPPTEGRAVGQLRLEYFEDGEGQQLIPSHVSMSAPFTSSADNISEFWHLVELYDRVPDQAQSMKFSILLLSQQPNGQKKQVWVDDAFLEVQPPRSRYQKTFQLR